MRPTHYLTGLLLLLGGAARGQAVQPLPMRPARVQVARADSLIRLPRQRITIYCPFIVTTWNDNILDTAFNLETVLSRVTSVQVTPYSGAPGALSVVRIRGAAGLAGNPQPLYLLDDVPVFQNLGAAQVPDNYAATYQNNALLDLDPLLSLPTSDIASVTVLKGPLETARYGAQGQNGVISIRTKAGKLLTPLRLTYSVSGGVQQARSRYHLLTARQFGEVANEVNASQQQPPQYSPSQLEALGEGTDWQSEVLRTTSSQEHHLGLSGGRATTRYYVGVDYQQQNGVLLNSWLQRVAVRANVEHRLTPQLTLTATLGLSQLTARRAAEALTFNMLAALPTQAPYTAGGQFTQPSYYADNPVRQAMEEIREPRQRQLQGRLELRYALSPYWKASLLGHWEQNNLLQTWHFPDYLRPDAHYADERDDNQFRQATVAAALDFARTLAERHAFVARLEQSWQECRDDKAYVLIDSQLANAKSATYNFKGTLLSPAAQASYTYDHRYQVQGNVRFDRSTALPLASAWQTAFGSKLAWHGEAENFLRDLYWLNTLSVWVGYSRTTNAGNFFDHTSLAYGPAFPGGTTTATPYLERVTQLEAGIMTRFWQKLEVRATAYQRQTTPDFPVQRAASQAGPNYHVRNQGLEVDASWQWVGREGWRSSSSVGASWQQNIFNSSLTYLANNYGQLATDGHPLGAFYGLRYLGADATTGRPSYQDSNGDGRINSLDAQYLGSGLPRYLLNAAQDLICQRWELQLQVDALLGYQVYNTALSRLDEPTGFFNSTTRVLDRWTPAHPTATVPAAGQAVEFGTYQLQSGNHIRLTSLTISYKLWEQGVRSATVWVGGRNLAVLSGYRGFDPNVSSGGAAGTAAGLDANAYPVARTWLAGVWLVL